MNNPTPSGSKPGYWPMNKQGLVLGCFALLVTTALALTHALTKNRIKENQQVQYEQSLSQVLPAQWQDFQIQKTPLVLPDTSGNYDRRIHFVSRNDTKAAAIISASAPDGYSGNIEMLVGILKDGTITGVRITQHSETPGLGDAIESTRSDWIKSFNDKSLENPTESRWKVRKNNGAFDQFTGATITPRAVVNEVKNTLLFFAQVQTQLFNHE